MTDFIRELYYGNLRPMSEGEIPDDLAELESLLLSKGYRSLGRSGK